MVQRTHRGLVAGLMALMAGSVSAQIVKPVQPLGPSNTVGYTVKSGQALITGTAVDDHALPLPNASLRLRNLVSKEIEQVATANYLGEFAFVARPEVPYVIEITDRLGRILAVGDIITAQSGDVAGALVSIPGRMPAVAGVFGDTAASVASAATGTGITVVEPSPPLSPER